ncbi:hypothetical protein IT408_01830 [Candidatus Uhrbacteria bacterium]|nr:hypothetical protein [Candidatus Uhrbacteria bacterium]
MADFIQTNLESPKNEVIPASPPIQEESSVQADARAFENLPKEENFLEETEQVEQLQPLQEKVPVASAANSTTNNISQKDEVTVEVEKVLEEGLGDFYATLPPNGQALFKKKGEQASFEISKMVHSLQLNVKRALQLIRDWLLTIPRVNKFFLEQEAKIKVDKIALLIEARKEDILKRP